MLCSVCAVAQIYPEKPNPPKLVNDFTKTLSTVQIDSLEHKLVTFDNQTTNQVAIVIVSTINGSDPTDYANEIIRKWGIGNKTNNNGVLLLIAKDDRKLSVAPGYGLEGSLPDATCKSIIDNEIVPSFKADDYYDGINKGIEAIMQATQGSYVAPEGYGGKQREGIHLTGAKAWIAIILVGLLFLIPFGYAFFFFLFKFFSLLSWLFSSHKRRESWKNWRNSNWWFSSSGETSSNFLSSDSSSFSGFGGGSSGGGGASGSW